jgi:hypothetical protein
VTILDPREDLARAQQSDYLLRSSKPPAEPSFFGRGGPSLPANDPPSFFGRGGMKLEAQPEPTFMFPAFSELGMLERGIKIVGGALSNSIFPPTVNTGPMRPSVPIPGTKRSLDLAGGLDILSDVPAPGGKAAVVGAAKALGGAVAKAGVPLMALIGDATTAGLKAKGKTVFKGSGGLPHEALRGGKLDLRFSGDPSTGQGAQTYAHGLYFAENPAVGNRYKHELTDANGNSTLIEAKLDIEPGEFLDWDKPLKDQSEYVKTALTKNMPVSEFGGDGALFVRKELDSETMTAGEWIRGMRDEADPQAVSGMLRESGIPAVRFLDQGSRGGAEILAEAGGNKKKALELLRDLRGDISEEEYSLFSDAILRGQTRNIVLFDTSRATVTHMNGRPVVIPGPGSTTNPAPTPKGAGAATTVEPKQVAPFRRPATDAAPNDVVQTLNQTAFDQRGAAESAMLRLQREIGSETGGEASYTHMVEHGGDILHRMTENMGVGERMRNVGDKTRMLVRTLENRADRKLLAETIPMNDARKAAMARYVDEHRKLPVYNKTQWRARQIAIALGEQDYQLALIHARTLKNLVDAGPEAFAKAVFDVKRDPSGKLIEFTVEGLGKSGK